MRQRIAALAGLEADLSPVVSYEGYGPGGVAVLVECVTDDAARTVAELRQAFARHGGSLGASGSVAYLFHEVGLMNFPPGADVGRLIDVALDAGAEDVVPSDDGSVEVLTDPLDLDYVRAMLGSNGFAPASAEVTRRAAQCAELSGAAAESMLQLLEALVNINDVRNVYSNAEIPNEVLARI